MASRWRQSFKTGRQVLDREFSVIDHFDLRSGSSIYRVFLLQSGLEVDIAVTPGEDFGARGPQFRVLFGSIKKLQEAPQPSCFLLHWAWLASRPTRSVEH